MTLIEHLIDRLQNPARYVPTPEDEKVVKYDGVESFIFRKLMSGKFRKTSVDEATTNAIKHAIHLNVSQNKPIAFTYPFGGYKIWRVPTYPYVDWAEFFLLSYVIRYIAPILQVYTPGVHFYFSSDDVVIEQIDNYPRSSLDAYVSSFKALIATYAQYFPKNLRLELVRVVPDLYSPTEYKKELNKAYQTLKKQGYDTEKMAALMKGFVFNFMVKGGVDYSKKSDDELKKLFEDLVYYSDGYLPLPKRRGFVRGEDKIVLFSNKIPNALDIGSLASCRAKFWAGIGVLEADGGKWYERILTPTQWDAHKNEVVWEKTEVIDGENFKTIPVFNTRFDFLGNRKG